jgi:hypothetical protein
VAEHYVTGQPLVEREGFSRAATALGVTLG